MRNDLKSTVRSLQFDRKRNDRERDRLAAAQTRLAAREADHEKNIEDLVLKAVRDKGLLTLPPETLVQIIAKAAAAANEHDEPQAGAERPEVDDGVNPEIDGASAKVPVFVKFSRNGSDENKTLLKDAGLTWHGKRGGHVGMVDASSLQKLREKFEKVMVEPNVAAGQRATNVATDAASADGNGPVGGSTAPVEPADDAEATAAGDPPTAQRVRATASIAANAKAGPDARDTSGLASHQEASALTGSPGTPSAPFHGPFAGFKSRQAAKK
jgi:hypothetical protein